MYSKASSRISPNDISVNLHIGMLGLLANKLLYAQKVLMRQFVLYIKAPYLHIYFYIPPTWRYGSVTSLHHVRVLHGWCEATSSVNAGRGLCDPPPPHWDRYFTSSACVWSIFTSSPTTSAVAWIRGGRASGAPSSFGHELMMRCGGTQPDECLQNDYVNDCRQVPGSQIDGACL